MAIVQLYDIDENAVSQWAIENCKSFAGWLIYDNTSSFGFVNLDDEFDWMLRYEFEFTDDHEALLFRLKWQGTNES